MTVTLTWSLKIDWDRDGAFGAGLELQTFRKIKWRRGRKNRVRNDGRGQEHPEQETVWIEIYDPDGRYDSFNTASPIYADLGVSGVALCLYLTSSVTPEVTKEVFTGVLTKVSYSAKTKRATLIGEGLARYLQIGAAESPITPAQSFYSHDACFVIDSPTSPQPINWWRGRTGGLTIGRCVDLTLTQAGWPFGSYHGTVEYTDDQPDYFYLDGSSAWEIIKSLADGFAARLFFLRDGRLFDLDRQDAVGLLEAGTPPAKALEEYGLERPSPFECLRNLAKAKVIYHTLAPYTTYVYGLRDEYLFKVWENSGPVKVLPGQTVLIDVEFNLNGKPFIISGLDLSISFEVDSCWSNADKTGTEMYGTGLVSQGKVRDGDYWYGRDEHRARIYLTNDHTTLTAYFFGLYIEAFGIIQSTGVNIYQVSDAASVALNGIRAMKIESPWIQSEKTAAAITRAYVSALSKRQNVSPATLAYAMSEAVLYDALVNLDLGSHVDFGTAGGATALANFGLHGKQLIVGQELEWQGPTGQHAIVKLTYEHAKTTPIVGNSVVSVGVNATVNGTHIHTVASGEDRLLLVAISKRAFNNVTAVFRGSQVLTKYKGEYFAAGNYPQYELWYVLNPEVGTYNIAVILPANDWFEVCSIDFRNVDQVDPFSAVAKATGTGTGPALTLVSQVSSIVVDILAIQKGDGITLAANGGQTQKMNASSNGNWAGAVSTKPGAASVATGWTVSESGHDWIYASLSVHGV
jgi:hypothetical protein